MDIDRIKNSVVYPLATVVALTVATVAGIGVASVALPNPTAVTSTTTVQSNQ